ncbi:8-oxoguanine glycosylase OGG1 TDEL_0D00970 [Torulaspora delbrueckii]|uniref:N-glycosylase/DNA lyase n=1 Tax=Torulaspora delbrueckii TaxID=4950 RepID=G8ZST7_TORDE|nr:hypothetical protein TDEL_0D00970 [Torulaspora delbrueckii]CCE91681.1 hypothetical protein TDEL_0D00970 [Torulaspora delbrueckii]
MSKFAQINIANGELYLENVLQAGQAFRWVLNEVKNHYSSTMKIGSKGRYSVVILRQPSPEVLEYASLDNTCDLKVLKEHLVKYFRLEVSLHDLHSKQWLPNDSRFEDFKPKGVRMLGQEPWETLVSFICSSNNNISRITKMCHGLSTNYGNKLGTFDSLDYFSFPTSDEIANKASEEQLRELGFGYRAKYIMETAKQMVQDKKEKGFTDDTQFLEYLRSHMTYEQMREHLMTYTGVGPKVADCICLMGLRMDEVVPVDVHVGRIAKRDYQFQAKKSDIKDLAERYRSMPITRKKINFELDLIRLMFLKKWGPYAGWAQGVLFSNEIGKTSGVTSSGVIKRRKLEVKVEVNNDVVNEVVTEEEVQYSNTGRPKRKVVSELKVEAYADV